MTVDGRFVARLFMGLAGCAMAVLGVLAYNANRFTLRDAILFAIAFLVGAIAALWLRWHSRQHGGRHRA